MPESNPPSLVRPFELQPGQSHWYGDWAAEDIWELLQAARSGCVKTIARLVEKDPSLVHADYWYTPPIHFAVREGHLDAVKLLVEAGADASHRSLDGEETLMDFASDRGHVDVVDFLKQRDAPMFAVEQSIHTAIKRGAHDEVRSLLKESPDLANSPGQLGRTPLHYAVETEDKALVELLVESGADVDAQGFSSDDRLGGHGFRPVTLAMWHHPYWRMRNCLAIARLLLNRGARYTLPIAAAMGDQDQVRKLLDSDDADPNFQESGGKRAISAAAERNYLDIVRLLLSRGADPNLPEGPNCPRGYALWSAARFGYREVAELLLEHGADPNAQVESSGSPIDSAKDDKMRNLLYRYGGRVILAAHFHQGNMDVIAALLERCPEKITESEVAEGFTMAASNDDEDMIRLLLARGLRVPNNVTACQTYLWRSLRIAELLLQNGMDPNLPNWQLVRPLHHMAATGNVEAAKLFLKYGADPTLIDEEYRSTPLGWAARKNQQEFIEFLLDHEPKLRDLRPLNQPDWARPIAWARRRKHQRIVELLS